MIWKTVAAGMMLATLSVPVFSQAETAAPTNGQTDPGTHLFSTRYLITTNALPIEKGQHYFNLSPLGPDIQFALNGNVGIGLLSSWAGFPLVLSLKYTVPGSGPLYAGVGTLIGSGTYFDPDFLGALPYGMVTWGNRSYNVTVSGGYGYLINGNIGSFRTADAPSGGTALIGLGGMARVLPSLTLVFDSVIAPQEEAALLAIPMVRWQNRPDRAWQFGFAGLIIEGSYAQPIPIIQWYRKIE